MGKEQGRSVSARFNHPFGMPSSLLSLGISLEPPLSQTLPPTIQKLYRRVSRVTRDVARGAAQVRNSIVSFADQAKNERNRQQAKNAKEYQETLKQYVRGTQEDAEAAAERLEEIDKKIEATKAQPASDKTKKGK